MQIGPELESMLAFSWCQSHRMLSKDFHKKVSTEKNGFLCAYKPHSTKM